MAYWEVVTRSFRIAWRFKYLWLLALFSGEAGGAFNFNYNIGPPTGSGTTPRSLPNLEALASYWLSQHVALVVALGVMSIVLAIALFVLGAVCEGALVRAAAEHDAERPFRLGAAWRCGVSTMGRIILFRLLLVLLYLPVFIVLGAVVVGLVMALVNQNAGAAVAFGVFLLVLTLIAIPYSIYIAFLDRLGTRAIVLELLQARPALSRAHRLLVKRIGRVLLVWLLSIGVGLVLAICASLALAVLIVPALVAAIAVYASGSPVFWLVVAVGFLIVFPVAVIVSGFVAAQGSTYWTLAFRRLEIDQAPGYAYPQPVPPQAAG